MRYEKILYTVYKICETLVAVLAMLAIASTISVAFLYIIIEMWKWLF